MNSYVNYIHKIEEPEMDTEQCINVERTIDSFKQIKNSIMIDQLIRLHAEALDNLSKQQILSDVIKKLDPSAVHMRKMLIARRDGLAEKYSQAQTELFKILESNK